MRWKLGMLYASWDQPGDRKVKTTIDRLKRIAAHPELIGDSDCET